MLSGDNRILLTKIGDFLAQQEDFSAERLEEQFRALSQSWEMGLGKIMQPLRSALTGNTAAPSLFEVMEILGKTETLNRINAVPDV